VDDGRKPDTDKRTVAALYLDLHTVATNNSKPGSRRAKSYGWRWNHLGPYFGAMLATDVKARHIELYNARRRKEGANPATVNANLRRWEFFD
jgi:hypothetical protein